MFLAQGYTVAVPMRKGRGGSGGPLLEGTFDSFPPEPQIASGIEDIDAAIRYFAAQPYVDPAGIVIVGVERGGLLAIAYAARHPGAVAGIVNVSGEWWPASYRDGAINTEEFAAAGATVTCPTLWLYALSPTGAARAHVLRNLAAFQAAGGNARLALVPEPGGIVAYGTHVFNWPARWEDVVAGFLKGLAAPDPPASTSGAARPRTTPPRRGRTATPPAGNRRPSRARRTRRSPARTTGCAPRARSTAAWR
jgi:dienelactone hydrolase